MLTISACRYLITIGLCLAFFFLGTTGHGYAINQMIELGFGAVDQRTLLSSALSIPTSGTSGLLLNALIANSPQVILSMVYYTYNSLFTCFMISAEWDRLARQRKGLRVSQNPIGAQRSTYFLQLPYRIALPLMAFSGVLHWFCAQSLFLVSILIAGTERSVIVCGYSPAAILGLTILGIIMFFGAFIVGNMKLEGVIPFAGTCSASISAMCHLSPEPIDEDPSCLPLQWGVTEVNVDVQNDEPHGHCSISHQDVDLPENGKLYAGI
jgi:hypothetical protein